MSLGEFELIGKYFQYASKKQDLVLGNGDDAAVVATKGQIVVAADTLVEGTHFPADANPELIARRALRVNLSDMAAMGAVPRWFTLALTLPEVNEQWLQSFSRGLFQDAKAYDCELIGGDTTKGSLNIGIQMLGELPGQQSPLTRSGAKSGDVLAVTGTVGDAGAALQKEQDLLNTDMANPLMQAYWLPEPRVAFAQKAAPLIHAAIDISDGLAADAGHIAFQSGLAVNIDLEKLPISEQARVLWQDSALKKALVSGDDYELCLAVPRESFVQLEPIAQECGHSLTSIGHFVEGEGVQVFDKDGAVNMDATGYQHF